MNLQPSFRQIESEYNALVDDGNIEEAVRYSGEQFAMSDARWTSLVNTRKPADAALCESNHIGALHAESLYLAGADDACFSTAMLLLMRSADRLGDDLSAQKSVLSIPIYALLALSRFMGSHQMNGTIDDFLSDHATAMLILLASFQYSLFMKISKTDPSFAGLADVRGQIEGLIAQGLVREGEIKINGKAINSDDYPAIIGDVMGRGRAIGLFRIE